MQNLMLGIILATFYRTVPESEAAQGDVNSGVTILGFMLGVPTNMAFFNMVGPLWFKSNSLSGIG